MLTRRQFIKTAMATTAALQLSEFLIPHLAEAFIGKKKPPVIWLEMMTCTGDFLSVANTLRPDMRELLFDTIDLCYSNTAMAAEGDLAIGVLKETVEREKGEYILIAEGTVPLKAGAGMELSATTLMAAYLLILRPSGLLLPRQNILWQWEPVLPLAVHMPPILIPRGLCRSIRL